MMFSKLFAEIEAIQQAFPEFGILEAVGYIKVHAAEFDADVVAELNAFMSYGAEFFAEA